jgi:Protein of unknown function (DUF3800)
MSPIVDQELQVRPDCLMFFIDETGHEEFADPNYPVFGIGGCAILAGAAKEHLKKPWRDIKANHFGSADAPLHASDLKNPSADQIEAIATFFRRQMFGRFAVTITSNATLPEGLAVHQLMVLGVRKRWEELASRITPAAAEIAFLHEASERGDALIRRFFSDTKVTIEGKTVPVHFGFMPKWTGDEALEVADFIVHAAGRHSFALMRGRSGFRRDFQAVFQANPLWSRA